MIKILIINLFLLFSPNGDYCDGFERGYKDGYCNEDPNCIEPITPNCPLRRVNEKDDFTGGYQRGFKLGLCRKNQ